jgi:hypothetical protein
MKNNLLVLMGIVLASFSTMAQEITGTVKSAADNSALPGVSVIVKGTTNGITADANGAYRISANSSATLVFSFVGFDSQEIVVRNSTIINVSLSEDAQNLQEVVVTALGIKKDAKKLGYATSTIQKEALTENRQPNFMNALQGKVAGVNISSMGTGPGGTSKIRIRGQSSISGPTD